KAGGVFKALKVVIKKIYNFSVFPAPAGTSGSAIYRYNPARCFVFGCDNINIYCDLCAYDFFFM
ncbi:hypothetical protein, partial [Dickeya dianthicola]|uniref:hypothetical protein n=1 Tax=Dickeya dianthicola TaxID=204039 RepID=UPI001EE637D7